MDENWNELNHRINNNIKVNYLKKQTKKDRDFATALAGALKPTQKKRANLNMNFEKSSIFFILTILGFCSSVFSSTLSNSLVTLVNFYTVVETVKWNCKW